MSSPARDEGGGAAASPAPPILSPDQLAGTRPGAVRVGGRLDLEGGRWRLVNALAAVPLELVDASGAVSSAIASLEATWDGAALRHARLLDLTPSAAPPRQWERVFHGGIGARLELRARLLAETRRVFEAQGFLEIDTPLRSQECGTETHVEPIASEQGYLITSPELHMKRLLVAGVPRLFQLVHCFRAGELGRIHSPEFLMLEWYRAFADYTAVLQDTERLIQTLHRSVAESDVLTLPSGARVDMSAPFERLSVRQAFTRFAGVRDAAELAARDEDEYFQLLVDKVEPGIAALGRPVFLLDYPASQAALARLSPADPSVAERFELYVGDVELCNGYGELTDPIEQRARCESDRVRRRELGRHVPEVPERFLSALLEGMPPASGNALGMDRLLMLLLGQERIDAVTPFASADA